MRHGVLRADAVLDRLLLPLEAVLLRVTRPLSEVEGLAVGDLLPFGTARSAAITLETGGSAWPLPVAGLAGIDGIARCGCPGPVTPPAIDTPAPGACAFGAGQGRHGLSCARGLACARLPGQSSPRTGRVKVMAAGVFRQDVRQGVPLVGHLHEDAGGRYPRGADPRRGSTFVCLDAEHAPFDRGRDQRLRPPVARAAGFPMLVRVSSADPCRDRRGRWTSGRSVSLVPHVTDAATAARVARAARFGASRARLCGFDPLGGLRHAGHGGPAGTQAATRRWSSPRSRTRRRWRPARTSRRSRGSTRCFWGLPICRWPMARPTNPAPSCTPRWRRVGRAAQAEGKGYATFVPHAEAGKALEAHGFSAWFVASEHAWILAGARMAMQGVKGP